MKYLPLKFHIVYIIFTVLFSFFGPREYANYDKSLVAIFIGGYLIAVTFGFYLGMKSKIKLNNNYTFEKNNIYIFKLFKIAILLSLFFTLLSLIYQVSQGRLNLNIFEIGKNYADFYEYYAENKDENIVSFELLLLLLIAIPKYLAFCLGFYLLKSLPKNYAYTFYGFLLASVLLQTISNGNQKSLADIFIIGSIAATIGINKINRSERNKIIVKIIILIVVLFGIFAYSQYSRLDSRNISAFDINDKLPYYTYYNLDHAIFHIFGYQAGFGISSFITGYLSGGYYGLSKCFELPFEWSYGVGNSVSLTSAIRLLFDVNLFENTYLYRMQETFGINGKTQWHTIFPWLASDITFLGIFPLFFGLAYFYGKSWKEVLIYSNPVSLLLFTLLSNLFIFVVANNQIVHGYDYFLVTMFVVIFYILRKNQFNLK